MQGKIKEYDCYEDVDEKFLFLNLQHCKCFTFRGDSCHGKKKSKELLLSLLVTGKYKRVYVP
jgi:hypothetical protein